MKEKFAPPEEEAAAKVSELIGSIEGSEFFNGSFSDPDTKDTYIIIEADISSDIDTLALEKQARDLGINTFIEHPAIRGDAILELAGKVSSDELDDSLPLPYVSSYYHVCVVNPFDTPARALERRRNARKELNDRFEALTGHKLDEVITDVFGTENE